jgi:hypothetical protein
MVCIKKFEKFQNESILVIVDVQKSFKKFFSEMYLNELKKYCNNFTDVYQIFDNHVHGKNPDKDYLYDHNPGVPDHNDIYNFPNQKDIIEKRYNYDVDVEFYKKILSKEVYSKISKMEENKQLKRGDMFPTKEGTVIVYIGNNHVWFHCPKKLYDLLESLKGKNVEIVGGASEECLLDIVTTGESLGVKMKTNFKFIWSANHCPIK